MCIMLERQLLGAESLQVSDSFLKLETVNTFEDYFHNIFSIAKHNKDIGNHLYIIPINDLYIIHIIRIRYVSTRSGISYFLSYNSDFKVCNSLTAVNHLFGSVKMQSPYHLFQMQQQPFWLLN